MPLIWIVVAIISAVSAGGVVQQIENKLTLTPTPTFVQELQKEMPWITPIESVIEVPESPPSTIPTKADTFTQPSPTTSSRPTIDPDPLITCNSKTGKLQVRRSVCSSNTDCPDGYGGYVFESQQACKDRWQKISANLKQTTNEYVKSIQESSAIQAEQYRIQQDLESRERQQLFEQQSQQLKQDLEEMERKAREEQERILREQQEYFKDFIKSPTPTPTTIPAGYYGNVNY